MQNNTEISVENLKAKAEFERKFLEGFKQEIQNAIFTSLEEQYSLSDLTPRNTVEILGRSAWALLRGQQDCFDHGINMRSIFTGVFDFNEEPLSEAIPSRLERKGFGVEKIAKYPPESVSEETLLKCKYIWALDFTARNYYPQETELCIEFAKLILKNPKLFFQFPKIESENCISYFENEVKLLKNQPTKTKPARWFVANNLGSEKEAIAFSDMVKSLFSKPENIFFLSEKEGGLSEENWVWAYRNTSGRTGSCMIKCPDIARCYADNPDLDLVYMVEKGAKDSNNTVARTIIRKDTKAFIRIYYYDHRHLLDMQKFLQASGYKEKRDMGGISLKFLKKNQNTLLLPYVDGDSYTMQRKMQEDKEILWVVPSGVRTENDRKTEVYVRSSSGQTALKHRCKHCGYLGRPESLWGKGLEELEVCSYCKGEFIKDKDNKYAHYSLINEVIYTTEWGMLVNSDAVLQDLKKITCPFSRSNEITGTIKDRDDNNIQLNFKGAYTKWPCTTFRGHIESDAFTRIFNVKLQGDLQKFKYFNIYDSRANNFDSMKLKSRSNKVNITNFLNFLLAEKVIEKEFYDSQVSSLVPSVIAQNIDLISDSGKIARSFNEESGEIIYEISLTEKIKSLKVQKVQHETKVVIDEFDQWLKDLGVVEVYQCAA